MAGGASAGQPTLKRAPSGEELLRNFDIVVFRNEFEEEIQTRLRKWVDPVRIYLDVRAGDPAVFRPLMDDHIAHLVEITGHDMAIVEDPEATNVTVVFERESRLDEVATDYFPGQPDIETVMRTNLCFGRYHSNMDYEIFEAVIVIPTDRVISRGKLSSCIIEETTQVLGLPNDSDEVFPSIFNDKSIDDELTEQDIILIRLLYDPRLAPGMPRQEVLERVGGMLKEIHP
jgi:hypothetical protein